MSSTLVVYFTQTSSDPHNVNIDIFNYYYNGEDLRVPPLTCVVCIPCNNDNPDHLHNVNDCVLLTYERGWDNIGYDDFVTIYIMDNDSLDETLQLDSGELLGSFLSYNQEYHGVAIDKCVMGVNPYLPLPPHELMDSDGGYETSPFSDEE